MKNKAIQVKNITKTFGHVTAVDDLSFYVAPATCFSLLGPNGAGKTTMMKMIYARTLRDQRCKGSIDIFGHDPAKHELQIKYFSGVVPQEDNLDEELNVIQNLMIYANFYRMGRNKALKRINSLLNFMELSEKANSRIRDLSGGMKRRLVIARALINEPKLLILDEPTTGLDPQVRHLIWDRLRLLKRKGTTILLTTHYMEEAYQIADEILIMHQGKKILQNGPDTLIKENIEKFVLELQIDQPLESLCAPELFQPLRIDRTNDVLRLYSSDIEKLKIVVEKLTDNQYYLRQSNLEDVFLRATGRTLNASQ
jgi:lipooligosaccharide transport system ATP-binding protein